MNFFIQISFFFEKDAFNEQGELIVPKHESINKIGHCLHMKNDVFKKVTFSDKVKQLIKQLNYKRPSIPQSMYIFKNSKIGGKVVPHKDGSFLFTEPNLDLIGLWFPMVNVTKQNGCLSYVPKSHLDCKRKLFVRDENNLNNNVCKFVNENQEKVYSEDDYVPIEVIAGDCVLIHGLVVHQSQQNETDKGRPVFTFHLLETQDRKWSKQNWLQEKDDYKFPLLFEN